MTDTIRRGEYYYAVVDDRPGVLYGLLEYFRSRGVNLVAFTAFPVGQGKSQLDFFPEYTAHFLEAAEDVGLELVGPRRAFMIQGEDNLGALVTYHRKLSQAGINVHAASGVTDGSGGFGYVLWVKPEDYEVAARTVGA